jgi:hypothetical protein
MRTTFALTATCFVSRALPDGQLAGATAPQATSWELHRSRGTLGRGGAAGEMLGGATVSPPSGITQLLITGIVCKPPGASRRRGAI